MNLTRPRQRPLIALLTLSFLLPASAASAGTRPARTLQLAANAWGAVAAIAGPGIRVRCSVSAADAGVVEALGHADWNRRLIELAPSICRGVNSLVTNPSPAYTGGSFAQSRALLVLVHEAVHLSDYAGHTDEALTECRAIQFVQKAGRELGLDDKTARALGHEAIRYDAKLPGVGNWMVGLGEIPNYHSPDCYDGGPLDIHPDSSDWPN